MIYELGRLRGDVRVALDENRRDQALLAEADEDTLSLDELIGSKAEDGVRRVVASAPGYLLDGGRAIGGSVFWLDRGAGRILLPDDFLRLRVFRMSDWERPVRDALTERDAEFGLQYSRYRGLRGNPQKPVVVITSGALGLMLEFFSCRSESATVAEGVYIPMPRIDEHGGIEIPERLYRSAVYSTAALTALTLGEGDLAGRLEELSNGLMI